VILFFVAAAARAGVFIEPTGGYTAGLLGQSGVPAINTKTYVFGGRLGYKRFRLRLGVDYSLGIGTGEQFGNKDDFKPTDLGLFAGYDLSREFRVYGSVFVVSKAKIQPSENAADFTGQSFRAGLGWSVVPYCTVIVEATSRIYSKYDGVSLSKALKGSTFGASIGIPLP